MNGFLAILQRDLRLAVRNRADLATPLLFFVLIALLFPLGGRPDPELISAIAPAVIWMAALLATLLSLDRLFRSDFDDGSLEQLLLSPYPAPLLVLAKVLAHWLTTGLPLMLLSPLLASMLGLPVSLWWVLLAGLALGTPTLSLVGAIGMALTVGLRRGGVMLALLVLPLYVPILIFGAGSVVAASQGLPVAGQLYFLAAVLVLGLTLAPLASAAALRIAVH